VEFFFPDILFGLRYFILELFVPVVLFTSDLAPGGKRRVGNGEIMQRAEAAQKAWCSNQRSESD
jgi:hypothetical protein